MIRHLGTSGESFFFAHSTIGSLRAKRTWKEGFYFGDTVGYCCWYLRSASKEEEQRVAKRKEKVEEKN